MFEACVTMSIIGLIVMQWYIIIIHKERFDKFAKLIKEVNSSKADKDHTHNYDYITGSMDMVYQGKKTPTVQAHLYPRRIK